MLFHVKGKFLKLIGIIKGKNKLKKISLSNSARLLFIWQFNTYSSS